MRKYKRALKGGVMKNKNDELLKVINPLTLHKITIVGPNKKWSQNSPYCAIILTIIYDSSVTVF